TIADAAATVPGVREAFVEDGTLVVRLAEGARPAGLVTWLVRSGVAIDEVRRDRQTLEEAFLELVSEHPAPGAPA
ncbi:MAG TPA: hypothetical protein VFZ73_17970, partial [Gemmatimonadaceae bacterium]